MGRRVVVRACNGASCCSEGRNGALCFSEGLKWEVVL